MRKARTERALSVAEVAEALGVTERKIKALEADDYAKLPAKVYVRGYIRRYCALLGIEEAPVLLGYERLSRGEGEESPTTQPRRLLHSRNFKLGLIGVVGVLVFVLLASLAFAQSLNTSSDIRYRTSLSHVP